MITLWTDFLQMAGTIGGILLITGIIGITIVIYKILSFMYLGIIPLPNTKLKPYKTFKELGAIKDKDCLISHAEYYITQLQSGFNLLNIIISIAPLLGLLGTVVGMIEAFQSMASMGDAVNISSLAGGIWKALITTATGLSVAIPVLICLHILQNIVEKHTVLLNKTLFSKTQ